MQNSYHSHLNSLQNDLHLTEMGYHSHFLLLNAHWRLGLAVLILYTNLIGTALSSTQVAPSVSFRTLSGDTLSLESYYGEPLLLSFWSTSCAICIHEMPDMKRLYEALDARGASMISVTMPYDPPNHVVEISTQLEIPFPVAIDLDGTLMKAFEIQGTPSILLIAPDGSITHKFVGALDFSQTLNAVDALLAQSE